MKIVLADVDAPTLQESALDLRARGADVMTVVLDVTDREGWAQAAREVPERMGPVQLLVNNAGVSTFGIAFDEISPELWDKVIAINLSGVYNGMHYFLPGMRDVGSGHIVNTASMAGLIGYPTLAPYCASKFAIVGLSEGLHAELAQSGIGISVLCPGRVRSRLRSTSRAVCGLPEADVPAPLGDGLEAVIDPDEVGRRVLDAVAANELYVITNPEFREAVTDRHMRLLQGFDHALAFTR